jgi:hypothetical protein
VLAAALLLLSCWRAAAELRAAAAVLLLRCWRVAVLFRPCLLSHLKIFHPSHRIFDTYIEH